MEIFQNWSQYGRTDVTNFSKFWNSIFQNPKISKIGPKSPKLCKQNSWKTKCPGKWPIMARRNVPNSNRVSECPRTRQNLWYKQFFLIKMVTDLEPKFDIFGDPALLEKFLSERLTSLERSRIPPLLVMRAQFWLNLVILISDFKILEKSTPSPGKSEPHPFRIQFWWKFLFFDPYVRSQSYELGHSSTRIFNFGQILSEIENFDDFRC